MKRILILTTSAAVLAACSQEAGDGTIEITEVDESTAASALESLHLANSGDGIVSWGERSFADGTYTFTDVTFTFPEDGESEIDFGGDEESAGSPKMLQDGEGEDTDEVHAERMILSGARFDADGNVIFDRLSIEEIAFEDEEDGEAAGSIASFEIGAPNAAMVADLAEAFSGEDDDEDDSSEWRYGLLALNDLRFEGVEDGESFSFGIARFAIEEYGGDRVGRFELSGFSVDGQDDDTGPIRVRLGEVSAVNVGPAITYPFGTQFQMIGTAMEGGDVTEADIPAPPEDYNPLDAYDSLAIRGLDIDIGGLMITMDSMTAEIDRSGDRMTGSSVMTPLIIGADPARPVGAQLSMGLALLGYDQLEFMGAGQSIYDIGEDRAYTDGENYFAMTDGFRIDLASDFNGLIEYTNRALLLGTDPENAGDPAMIMQILEPLVINSFSFRFQDDGLLDRGLTASATMQGMTPDQFRQQAAGMIAMASMMAPAEIPRPLLAEFSTAMSEFITNGGAVTIAMAPEEGVSLGELVTAAQGPAGIDFEAMGLSITAEPPAE